MRGSIKRALLGGTAVAMIAMYVPTAANAAAGDTYTGPGCSFDSNANQTIDPQGNQDGELTVAAFAQSGNTPDASAAISCWIATPTQTDIQSQTLLDATHGDHPVTNNGGVITGERSISYSDGVNHDQNVYLCEEDTDAAGSTTTCTLATSAQIPPQAVIDLLNEINDESIALQQEFTDPVVCAALIAVRGVVGENPGGLGLVTIYSDGDLYVADPLNLGLNPVEDCPIYGQHGT